MPELPGDRRLTIICAGVPLPTVAPPEDLPAAPELVPVPLTAPDGSGMFAFNCGAPAFHFTRERLENDIGPRLVNMVRNVEVALGTGKIDYVTLGAMAKGE